LVLFDFDGVLVDSLSVYEKTVTECLQKIGSQIVQNREDFLALFNNNFYEALAENGIDLEEFSRISTPILQAVAVADIIPFDSVCKCVEQIKIPIAIISSNSAQAIKAVFEYWNMKPFFREIFGSEFRYSKKEKIDYAMKMFGVMPKDTIYVGDTVGDIKEARQAGVMVAAVSWGWHNRKHLEEAMPDYLVDTPEELLAVIKL